MPTSTDSLSLHSLRLLPKQMQQDLPQFMARIAALLDELGLDLRAHQADHIALRINQTEDAISAHNAWLPLGNEISSAQINGRPIIVLSLDTPLQAGAWAIDCLELPYPAPNKQYKHQGWEHVEFVIPSQETTAEGYFTELKQRFPEFAQRCERLEELGIAIKLSSPKGEGERLPNPTVAFKKDGICIKLHPHSLAAVVASEQQ